MLRICIRARTFYNYARIFFPEGARGGGGGGGGGGGIDDTVVICDKCNTDTVHACHIYVS